MVKLTLLFVRILFILFLFVYCFGCTTKNEKRITVDLKWVDSVKASSDTSFVKKYRNNEFVSAEYFLNRKDSLLCQIMKDSSGNIRQIIQTRNNTRTYFAEFYANGQLKAKLLLDNEGKFNGPAIYYYENGAVKQEGDYLHGFHTGSWKNFGENKELLHTDEYDKNGQLLRSN